MILRQLESVLGTGKPAGQTEYMFNCPYCESRKGSKDTHRHLYVNPNRRLHGLTGWYYCHRCEARGSVTRLLGDKILDTRPPMTRWSEWLNSLKSEKLALQPAKVSLPIDYVPCFRGTEAYDYLMKRNFTDEIIADYKIGFGCEDLKDKTRTERRQYAGSGRIIFPDFDSDGKIVYWVARTYKGHRIKYKNPPDSDARCQVFNLSRAVSYSEVIITEGVISSIAAGPNAVATYGKDVTPDQVSMLTESGFERYFVALDGDATKRRRYATAIPPVVKLASSLSSRGCDVWIVRLPYEHDPASIDNFGAYLANAAKFTLPLKVELLLDSRY